MLGWIMLLVTVYAILFAILNVKKKPNISLLVATVVPFITFYYIGVDEYNKVFIFAAILYFAVVNVLFLKKSLKNLH